VAALSEAQAQLIEGVFGNVPQRLLNDVDAAQIGAFGGGAGILLLSGTGSMAWARDMKGRSHRTGGWGDVIGDEGSAHWMGQRILSAATQDLDGRGPRTGLTQELFRHLQLDPKDANNQLEGWASGLAHPRSGIAALAPLATRLAENGDAVAIAIVDQAADELARHVAAYSKQFAGLLDWSYAGGSFTSPALLDAVAKRVGRPPVLPRLPPIGGALLAAAKLADWPADSTWIARLGAALWQESVPNHRLSMTA
jgi:N-acetylglucosamine kinase-like BadF-type ATPase